MNLYELRLLASGKPRTETVDGKQWLVVPTIALMEGVIRAVNAPGAEFVPANRLAASVASWDGKPLVLGHPVVGGKHVSADHPDILARQAFGHIRAPRMAGSKFALESWVDPARLEALGEAALLADLRAGKAVEVSVGAGVTTLARAGTHGGKAYENEWDRISGDHLAYLPGKRGACSIEMGCGACRAAEGAPEYRMLEDGPSEVDRALWEDKSGNDDHGRGPADGHAIDSHVVVKDTHWNKTRHGLKGSVHSVSTSQQGKTTHYVRFHKGGGEFVHAEDLRAAEAAAGFGRFLEFARALWEDKNGNASAAAKQKHASATPYSDTPSEAASEEAAELITYRSIAASIEAAQGALADASTHVDELIADEEENPTEDAAGEMAEEEVEAARLTAVCSSLMTAMTAIGAAHSAAARQAGDANVQAPRYGENTETNRAEKAFRACWPRADGSDDHGRDEGSSEHAFSLSSKAHASGKALDHRKAALAHSAVSQKLLGSKDYAAGHLGNAHGALSGVHASLALKAGAKWEDVYKPGGRLKALSESEQTETNRAAEGCKCREHEETNMKDKAARIAALAANPHSAIKDVKALEAMTDDAIVALEAAATSTDGLKTQLATLQVEATGLRAAAAKTMTAEEFLASPAGAPLKIIVDERAAVDAVARTELVTVLKAAQSAFSEDDLKAMPTPALAKLAEAVKVETSVNYGVRGLAAAPKDKATDRMNVTEFAAPNGYDAGIKALQGVK